MDAQFLTIIYPIEAVRMKYLTKEQAIVYGAIKGAGKITREEISVLGIPLSRQEKILGMLETLERVRLEGNTVFYIPNGLSDEGKAIEIPTVKDEPAYVQTVEEVQAHVIEQEEIAPSTDKEKLWFIENFVKSLVGRTNFKRLSDPSIDIDATIKKIYDYYSSKNWKVGESPIKRLDVIVKRAVGDNYPNPWALTQKSLKHLAQEADNARAALQVNEEPTQECDQVPWSQDEREKILIGLVEKKIGPKPPQSLYTEGKGFLTAEESNEWMIACKAYDFSFKNELANARQKLANVPTSDLPNSIL